MILAESRSESQLAGRRLDPAFPLALVRYDTIADGEEALARCARLLQGAGRRVGGVVQTDRKRLDRRKCDMFLQNLSTGDEICMSFDRGDEARGCRLDHGALAQATLWAEHALTLEPELLILNKFGKEEGVGRGFFPVIVEALSRDIPVLAGVSARNLEAARIILDRVCVEIDAVDEAIVGWFELMMRLRGPSAERLSALANDRH